MQKRKCTYPYHKVKEIRFDFRLHLNLDSWVDVPSPRPVGTTSNNYAGVFRYNEALPTIPGRAAQTIFAAVEKPLIYEMTAKAYVHGRNNTGAGSPSYNTWDNLHWWPHRIVYERAPNGRYANPNTHISAPGAFHAVHFHWRWGGVAHDTHPLLPNTDHYTAPQFASNAPNIDANIGDQSLRFAIVKYAANQDPNTSGVNLSALSLNDFFSLFRGPKPSPDDISAADNLVLWLSVEVYKRDSPTSLNGTMLIHGFFFAHNPESGAITTGSRSAEYFPNSASTIRSGRNWERY